MPSLPPSSWPPAVRPGRSCSFASRGGGTRTSARSASTTGITTMPAGERLAAAIGAADTDRLPGLLPYVTAGFPRLDDTVAVLLAAQSAGCVAAEIGIPFSDPLADGPTIQRAGWQALRNGVLHHRRPGQKRPCHLRPAPVQRS